MLLLLTFFSFFYTVLIGQQPGVEELRQLFYQANEDKKQAEVLFDMMSNYGGNDGVLIAYKAGAYALKAKHGANPISKLKNVKKSQRYFAEAVQLNGQNLEIRFMRYAVEMQTPHKLGLSKHISEDKALLLEGFRNYPDAGFTPETARIARDYMRQYCECSNEEKSFLHQLEL